MNTQTTLITYQPEESLAGGLAREIVVPEGHVALARQHDQIVNLPPGEHRLRNVWRGLLGQPVPPIWLVHTAPITLHPIFPNLLDADGQLIAADMLVLAHVTDAKRFWQTLSLGYADLSRTQLDWLLVQKLQQAMRSLVRRYPWESLLHFPEASESVQQGIMQSLRATLAEWGMELRSITHLSFQKALDAVEIERQVQDVRRQLDDLALQAQVEQLENEKVLTYARAELQESLTPADSAELEEKLEDEPSLQVVQDFFAEKLERLEQTIKERLDTLAQTEAPPREKRKKTPAELFPGHENLQRLMLLLRIAFYSIAAVTAASTLFYRYLPFLDKYNDHLHLAGAALGFTLAIVALVSSWVVNRRISFRRRRALEKIAQHQQTSDRAELIAQERGIRRYVEKQLRQIAANCEKTWKRIFDQDIDLATSLRTASCKPYLALADKVMAADEPTGRLLLNQDPIPVEDLAELLVLTEDVLDQVNQMAQISQQAYQVATTADLQSVRELGLALDQGCLAIENRFAERDQFLLQRK